MPERVYTVCMGYKRHKAAGCWVLCLLIMLGSTNVSAECDMATEPPPPSQAQAGCHGDDAATPSPDPCEACDHACLSPSPTALIFSDDSSQAIPAAISRTRYRHLLLSGHTDPLLRPPA
ncbi:MAG: hypothetical protein R3348_06000 [Xanthomonadales bacterium]|nr:hypothetical protein [Xanthomonadales bacterium]